MAEQFAVQRFPVPQSDPPLPPRETLPTMYDLPSEDPEEPGLPDEFHAIQPQLLRDTFQPPDYPPEQVFVASDMNVYYDVRHPNWHKRPDWFAVVGIDRLYEQRDLRLSYVSWQEGISPTVVVELLSPGTESEDLGKGLREARQPPSKWEVYEQILRIPYYLVYSRYTHTLRVFELQGSSYRAVELNDNRFWIDGIKLGIGLWSGEYQQVRGTWMRWLDAQGEWIPTPVERERAQVEQVRRQAERERGRAEQERKRADEESRRADEERQRADQLAAQLRALGVEPK
jgi:Uma2 family endonuclease